jgi:hypothetical protein
LADDEVSRDHAVEVLKCYYGRDEHATHLNSNDKPFRFTGALFDTWDSTGLREANVNRFTADDIVAVSFLSVEVSAEAAIRLLETEAADFSTLLGELGPDRDLATETARWQDDWVGWRLFERLRALPDVGPTTASKLLARKRPRLRPIYDSKVAEVIGLKSVWEPLRHELQVNTKLHVRLLTLRDGAGVGEAISAIRVFDVLAWMQGTGKGCASVRNYALQAASPVPPS